MEQPVQGHGKIVFCMEHAPARVRSVHLPRLGISYRSVALERMMTASGPWPLTAAGPAVRPDHVRNNVEHWFNPATTEGEAALALLTGCGAEETRRGQASAGAAGLRAAAVARYFLCAERFADLLVVFHMPAACA